MKLIGSIASPYVRKVRIVMAEKKLDYTLVPEDVWATDTTIAQYNPLGKVPCLLMDGTDPMFDSRVIVEYLDTLSPVGKLIPAMGRERAEVKIWEALADGVMDAAVAARLEANWTGRSKAQRSPAWIKRQMQKIQTTLSSMEKSLSEKPYCTGKHLSLADLAVGSALGYLDFRFPDLAWRTERDNLDKLFSKLMQRSSFAETLPG